MTTDILLRVLLHLCPSHSLMSVRSQSSRSCAGMLMKEAHGREEMQGA